MKCSIFQVRVVLRGSRPAIWRRLAVPSDMTLGQLHHVLQIAMGWMDGHLHQFVLRDKRLRPTREELARRFQEGALDEEFLGRLHGERYFVPLRTPDGEELEMEGEDEDRVTLAEVCPNVKSRLIYEYDFGDSWDHDIEVQKIAEPQDSVEYPVCLAGKRACPPEDSGGVWGYYEKLRVVADPSHEMHQEYREWLGDEFDPEAFDLDEVNAALTAWHKRRRPVAPPVARPRFRAFPLP
jgi:hypothetical protein